MLHQEITDSKKAEEAEVPKYLICPITLLIFLEPVTVLPTGHIYEKELIDALLKEGKQQGKEVLCPLARLPINGYVTAWNVKSMVDDYLKLNPNAHNQQYVREKQNSLANNKNVNTNNTIIRDIESDLLLARELQQLELEQHERQRLEQQRIEREKERERQSQEAFRQLQITEKRKQEESKSKVKLDFSQQKIRDALIEDTQNLIYALKFETGPLPKGRIDNFALLFFALIEQAFLEPLPWQKIKVHPGPRPLAMYEVLKAAIRALKETNPQILERAKTQYSGQYELVKTWLGGEKTLENSGYAHFAQFMGTVSGQPGDHIYRLLAKIEPFLQEVCPQQTNEIRLSI
jgi:U-box domain